MSTEQTNTEKPNLEYLALMSANATMAFVRNPPALQHMDEIRDSIAASFMWFAKEAENRSQFQQENKELKEQRDELLKLPEEYQWPHIKTLPELLRRAAEVLKLKAEQNEATSILVEPLINAAERIEKYSTKQN